MIPALKNKFVCIVSRQEPVLAGVVLSYIQVNGEYIPVFEFPEVEVKRYPVNESDENYIMVTRAYETSVRIHNALRELRGCQYLILVAIDDNQKSFFDYLGEYNVLDIQDCNDADTYLSGLTIKTHYLSCRTVDIYSGVIMAAQTNRILKIDDTESPLIGESNSKAGIVVIENHQNTSVLVAINYAVSINSDVALIEPPDISSREITESIENWKKATDEQFFNDLSAKIYPKVEDINFTQYQFCTFFTSGAPYSLILKNIIPFTQVNINLSPDFFIFNNIYFEISNALFSSIVFSPLEFGEDEETAFLIEALKQKKYYVKELVGNEATAFNIDRHVTEFPYNILHFCSHGGEVDGYPVKLTFKDRDGKDHTVEFDEIVSFAGEWGNLKIKVTAKQIFRKFDGYYWKSKELKAQNYPRYVINSDMVKAIREDKNPRKERVEAISDSCAIKCHDFTYQAMFNSIAGNHSNPFVFNNTCWSCSDIAQSFLGVGARGYIGTLWNVDNSVARNTAESFYSSVFGSTILNALHGAFRHSTGSKDENIYVFWGLHFATIKEGKSVSESRVEIARKLMRSFYEWRRHIKGVTNEKTRDEINRLIDWNCKELENHFRTETKELLAAARKPKG